MLPHNLREEMGFSTVKEQWLSGGEKGADSEVGAFLGSGQVYKSAKTQT